MSRSHRHRSATTLLAVATAAALAATGIACSDNSSDRADDTNVTSTTGSRSEAGGGGTTADITLATDGTLIATVDPRFASYNIEMVEVTGGEFWPPYDAGSAKVVREPIDLGSERLRNLARELGPVYIRVSGSWANSTYFDAEDTTGGVAPEGYNAVLTPDQWIGVGEFAKAGADTITIHPEAGPHLHRSLQTIRGLGKKAGVALNPATPVSVLAHVLDLVDLILVMSVNPGFGGQAFIPDALEKVRLARALAGNREILIEVDGGVTPENAGALAAAGADVLVAGSSVFKGGDYKASIAALRRAADGS